MRSGCIASQFTILFQFGMFIHIIPLRQKPQIDSDAAIFESKFGVLTGSRFGVRLNFCVSFLSKPLLG